MRVLLMIINLLIALLGIGAAGLAASLRIIKQYERGLIFRFGRVLDKTRGPGLAMIIPVADRLRKVNMQIVTMPVPAQEGITRDNVTVRVDAVVYFNVQDPVRAIVNVQDYLFAVLQVAQTSLRSVIGKSELDDLLSNRERLNEGLEAMKRSMSRQAEAERERRARIVTADGELQASHKLAQAAATMADTPTALQLRLLQTEVEVAADKNSTVVLPFPVELLRFLEKATTGQSPAQAQTPAQGQAASQPGPPAPAQPESPPRVAEVAAGAEPVPQLPAGDGIRAIEPSSTPSTTIN